MRAGGPRRRAIEERALSWYYYIEPELRFPFEAECVKRRAISPLRKGEKIQITALAPEEDCAREILVLSRWQGRSLGASACRSFN